MRPAGPLMPGQAPLTGGELNAAITRALVGIQNEYVGRGPRTASTFYHDNVIVTLMHDVLNRAEQALARSDRQGDVTTIRHLYQETMQADFTEAVERLTGHKVIAFISGNHADPDIASELFVLDAPI
ncbi:MAG: Na-translocating system protein MpsC family protein [Solirubrobacteraceae bacterium]